MDKPFRSIGWMALALSVAGLLAPPLSVAADNRFQEHRARLLARAQESVTVHGLVLGTRADDRLLTNIGAQRLATKGVGDLDQVWVHVGGKRMVARVMTEQTFQNLISDEVAMQSLDVDVVCLLHETGRMRGLEVVGLGGGLVPWINPRDRTPIIIEKVQP